MTLLPEFKNNFNVLDLSSPELRFQKHYNPLQPLVKQLPLYEYNSQELPSFQKKRPNSRYIQNVMRSGSGNKFVNKPEYPLQFVQQAKMSTVKQMVSSVKLNVQLVFVDNFKNIKGQIYNKLNKTQ
ncbi:Hypothetical_protein [Hexamita inflata]|uniref:Hypothetical_protein n=1 Tax=Hexamita inflata TaxID=28002 RepID=A0AA86UIC9_9EUKA|nr:Hypothetical protein HINF_LOCUS47085 [Hexamita inflata]